MSITNKLIANIKQTNVDITKFTDTNNVICIDTSTNRIGINTKNPRYSIDISGINSKIFVNNLEVTQNAIFSTISGNTIKCFDGSFTRNLDTSFINFKTISGSLVRTTTIGTNTIFGICGEIVDLSGTNIKISNVLRSLTISADTINTTNFTTVNYNVVTASFNILNVSTTIDTQTLIANTISCNTLTANYIKCNQTLSAESVASNNLQSANGISYFTYSDGVFRLANGISLGPAHYSTINDLIGYEVEQRINTTDFTYITASGATIIDCSITRCFIEDELNIKKIIKVDSSNGCLVLPLKNTNSNIAKSLAIKNFAFTPGSMQYINSLAFYNTNLKWSNIFTATHYATLDLSNLSDKNLASYSVNGLSNYKYIPIRFKTINNNPAKTDLFYIRPFPNEDKYIEISNIDLSSGIYEINASVTLSYTNTISGDVEPNDFMFGLYDKEVLDDTLVNNLINLNINSTTIETSYNYVKNKNLILAFDNSYNYSSVSLHYIGPLFTYNYSNIPLNYRRGICYLVSSQKEINYFNVEYFSSTIKLLNYYDN
jgi:hypothetical protein